MRYFVLDGREGTIARLTADTGELFTVDCAVLPENVAEGDCLVYNETEHLYTADRQETEARRQRLREKRMRLLHKERI